MRIKSPRRKTHSGVSASSNSSESSTTTTTQPQQQPPDQPKKRRDRDEQSPVSASVPDMRSEAYTNGVVASSEQQQRRKHARSEAVRPPPIDTSIPTSRVTSLPVNFHQYSPSIRAPAPPSVSSGYTVTDDATPSSSIHDDLMRALKLIEDERHLVAFELYRSSVLKMEELEDAISVMEEEEEEEEKEEFQDVYSTASSTSGLTKSPRRHHGRHFSLLASLKTRGASNSALQAEQAEMERNKRIEERQQQRRDIDEAKLLLGREKEEFERLEDRAILFQKAKENLTIDDDWKLSQTLFGITTYYRREDDNSLSIKLEGELYGIPLFEQLAVLRECDLYHHWAPFCTSSRKLAQLNKIDVVAWFDCGLPLFGIARDACFRAIGCDCMREDGSIMLVAEGLGDKEEDGADAGGESSSNDDNNGQSKVDQGSSNEYFQKMETQGSGFTDSERSYNRLTDSLSSYLSRDSILQTIQIPEIPTKFGSGRMTIRSFQGAIDVLGPSSARTRIVCNVNPNLKYIPQSLIDFCMKKMCGVLLSRLQGAARKVLKDPIKSYHARRMREDVGFYQHWLLPKFKSYCNELGWEMPPVGALTVNEDDLDEEEYLIYHQLARSPSIANALHTATSTVSEPATGVVIREGLGSERIEDETRSLGAMPEPRQHFSYSTVNDATSLPGPTPERLDLVGRSTIAGKSVTAGKSIVRKPATYFKEWESKAEEKKIRSIAASRRKAERRLKASTFTDVQKSRLEQLKITKSRAKERDIERYQSVLLRSTAGASDTDSVSVARSVLNASTHPPKDITRKGIVGILLGLHPTYTPLQTLPFLVISMFVVFFSSEVTPIYTFASSPVAASPDDATSLVSLKAIASFYFGVAIAHVWRIITTILIIGIFSIFHWSVVNAILTIGMDDIYIGEESARHSLEMGMKMFTKVGYKYVTIISVGIAAFASVKALLSSLIKVLVEAAVMFGIEKISSVASTFGVFGAQCWNFMPFRPLVEAISRDLTSHLQSMNGVQIISGCISLVRRIIALWSGTLAYIMTGVQQQIKDKFPMGNVSSHLEGVFLSSINVGIEAEAEAVSWRKSAIDTSRHALAYSALFHLTLFAAAHFLLQEPNKKKLVDSKIAQIQSMPSPSTSLQGSASSIADDSSVDGSILGSSGGSSSQWKQNINGPLRIASSQDSAAESTDSMPKISLSHDVIHEEDEHDFSDAVTDVKNESAHEPITPSRADQKQKKHKLKKLLKIPRKKNKMLSHPNSQPTISSETKPSTASQ